MTKANLAEHVKEHGPIDLTKIFSMENILAFYDNVSNLAEWIRLSLPYVRVSDDGHV